MTSKITIVGAGNVGHALAFEAGLKGMDVMLYEHPDFAKHLSDIKEKGGIHSVDALHVGEKSLPAAISGFAKINHLTTDPKEAMAFSDVICLTIPSFAQETMFKLILPHIRDNQILVLISGNHGALVLKKMMLQAGLKKKVAIVETDSSPYAVRVIHPGEVFILGKKRNLGAASMPVEFLPEHKAFIEEMLLIEMDILEDVIAVAIANVNLIIHVATATLGMGPMESREGKMQFYSEGCSKSVSKVLEQEDKERLEVGKAYGLKLKTFLQNMNTFYGLNTKSIFEFSQTTPVHNSMPNDSPKNPQERYISEDCPYGLVPLYSFAEKAGIECPTIKKYYHDR